MTANEIAEELKGYVYPYGTVQFEKDLPNTRLYHIPTMVPVFPEPLHPKIAEYVAHKLNAEARMLEVTPVNVSRYLIDAAIHFAAGDPGWLLIAARTVDHAYSKAYEALQDLDVADGVFEHVEGGDYERS